MTDKGIIAAAFILAVAIMVSAAMHLPTKMDPQAQAEARSGTTGVVTV